MPRVKHSVFSTALFLAGVTLVGRAIGFLREVLMVAQFGVGLRTDIAVVLLTLPDFLIGLLLSGGFSAALIPYLKSIDQSARVDAVRNVLFFVGIIFSVIAIGIWGFPQEILRILAGAVTISDAALYQQAFMLVGASLPIAALSGVVSAYLNAKASFLLPGFAVIIFNVCICLYLITGLEDPWLFGFAAAVFLATTARFFIQFSGASEIVKSRRSIKLTLNLELARLFIVGILAFAILNSVTIVFRSIFGSYDVGNVAVFNFSIKLFELPTAIIVGPLATVILPSLAKFSQDRTEFHRLLYGGVLAVLSVTIPFSALWQVFGEDVVRTAYQYGNVTDEEVLRIGSTSKVIFLALPFAALVHITSIALAAKTEIMALLKNCSISLGSSVLFASFFPSEASVLFSLVFFFVLLCILNLITLRLFFEASRISFARDIASILAKALTIAILAHYANLLLISSLNHLLVTLFAGLFGIASLLLLLPNFAVLRKYQTSPE